MQSARSLRYEYELYVEQEIEAYKESLSRPALLALGDEAVEALRQLPQTTLTEVVLCDEVDRMIARRLRLPTYSTWRRRHMRRLADLRRPERWGLAPEATLVRELIAAAEGEHVLFAGVEDEQALLFPAALGCTVTGIGCEPAVIDRAVAAVEAAGMGRRVRGCVGALDAWRPDAGFRVVVCTRAAFAQVRPEDHDEVFDLLQRATIAGGAHFVRAGGSDADADEWRLPSLALLETRYAGWDTAVERDAGGAATFVARKGARG